jgi:hypothetical protein
MMLFLTLWLPLLVQWLALCCLLPLFPILLRMPLHMRVSRRHCFAIAASCLSFAFLPLSIGWEGWLYLLTP